MDRPETKAEKQILPATAGAAGPPPRPRLGRSHAGNLVTYLVDHPTDFEGALRPAPARGWVALFLGLPEPPSGT